jgi:hypothetical protein
MRTLIKWWALTNLVIYLLNLFKEALDAMEDYS